jgi:hypothetical protein
MYWAAFFTNYNLIFLLLFISEDTLGSFLYVPCEVMEQEMEIQGSSKTLALNATLKGNISQSSGTGDVWLL